MKKQFINLFAALMRGEDQPLPDKNNKREQNMKTKFIFTVLATLTLAILNTQLSTCFAQKGSVLSIDNKE